MLQNYNLQNRRRFSSVYTVFAAEVALRSHTHCRFFTGRWPAAANLPDHCTALRIA
jgi:hypothetical protein